AELGAKVLVLADKASAERIDILDVLGVEVKIGLDQEALISELAAFSPDVLITSPGVPPTNPFIQHVISSGIPIWTDVDLAWRVRDKHGFSSQWLCITGTNGKTTVTQMVECMVQAAGIRAVACGNIGLPILDAVRDPAAFEILVVELSSFQLHYTNHIEPMVSAVLNVADDHLDWHGNFDEYAKAKGKIFNNTRICCVYNAEDKTTYNLLSSSSNNDSAQAVGFTKFTPTPNEVGWVEDILIDRAFVDTTDAADEIATLSDLSNIPVVSPHLLSNTAAAAAISLAAGVQPNEIAKALRNFSLDGHRIELVLEKDDIKWIDDSKATNPHAASAALSSFDSVVWIVGGLLKGVDISDLVAKYAKAIRAAIVIGVEREPVILALEAHAPDVQVIEIDHLEPNVMTRAVSSAKELAQPGDVVLLAPAAASMDQFVDYADRGEAFRKAVMKEVN
ncbi:MAG: UDP-N-acetylmuramoyl-L-alanine--D-glutamate ligase, partial [Microbacteriaceae bacterium]|nr:UDP-N-acetylmuramoyl-L-alanine--D-glutamate ligase [Microbacteriaceae bacterium]